MTKREFSRRVCNAAKTLALFVVFAACALRVPPATAACPGEIHRARAAAATIEREWPLRGADQVTDFVRALGDRLTRNAPGRARVWTFVVVRNRAANAFAVGDGRIYVTDGAIDTCATEAELAAIVAHEIGHQLADHFCTKPARSARRRRIGALIQHIDPAQEIEADRMAVQLLTAADYDPHAALTVANRVARDGSAGVRPDAARIQALRQLLEAVPATGRSDSEEFRRLKRMHVMP